MPLKIAKKLDIHSSENVLSEINLPLSKLNFHQSINQWDFGVFSYTQDEFPTKTVSNF